MPIIWEVDFYRRPLRDRDGNTLWELVVCDRNSSFVFCDRVPQSQAGSDWLVDRLKAAAGNPPQWPEYAGVFRPESVGPLQTAARQLELTVKPTRQTPALKAWLRSRQQQEQWRTESGQAYDPLALERPAPIPLPEGLWGDRWGFTSLPAGDLIDRLAERPMPFKGLPERLLPRSLGLADTVAIPGVAIETGRRSRHFATWFNATSPVALNFMLGDPDGLILESGLVDRWILATSDKAAMRPAAETFAVRRTLVKGLHFLIVQPDNTGMTYTGLWLLQTESSPPATVTINA